jgi:hypothetical protein
MQIERFWRFERLIKSVTYVPSIGTRNSSPPLGGNITFINDVIAVEDQFPCRFSHQWQLSSDCISSSPTGRWQFNRLSSANNLVCATGMYFQMITAEHGITFC